MIKATILHTEASTGWGGQEIRILTESAGMINRGYRVILACQPGSGILKKADQFGLETHIMRIDGGFDLSCIMRLRSLIQDEKVDIVNTHSSKDSWCAGMAAKLVRKVKVIRTRHLSIPVKSNFSTRMLYKTLPDCVITTGESIRIHLIEQLGISPDSAISIPTGIDLQPFDYNSADRSLLRSEFGIDPEAPLIITLGMIRSMKGHKYFIDAAAAIVKQRPDAMFMIVGDMVSGGDTKKNLVDQISSLGLQDKIIMTGYREDVPDILAAIDIFVLASIRYEGVPQAISQAMAMAKPVVATDVGSINEQVINGRTGILVEKENSSALADAILTLVKDPVTAREFGINGRSLVEEKLSLDVMLDKTESVYKKLLQA